MAISVQDVKELFKMTGAGMMECKKALTDANGDKEEAVKLLKERGLAAVAKRAERETSEGRIFIRQNGNKIAIAELCCETDFVSNNDEFKACGEKILDEIFSSNCTQVTDALTSLAKDCSSRFHENMTLSKVQVIEVPSDAVAGIYIHSNFKEAAVAVIKGSADDKVKDFARDCCMHLVAMTPAYTKASDVPQAYIDEQKEIFKKQMDEDPKNANKPENIKEKMLEGKMHKHLAEICFVDQMFVKDDKKSVSAKLDEVAKDAGAKLEFGEISLLRLSK